MATATYTPIATTTLGSAANTVSFSSISGAYTDLVIILTGTASTGTGIYYQVGNGSVDTGSNYSFTELYGDGSSAGSARASAYNQMAAGEFYTTQSTNIINLMNYSNTTTYKTGLSRGSNGSNQVEAFVNLWRSTAAINIITFSAGNVGSGKTFSVGSTFTLYGIKAA
jgi:hypothetical protein